MRFLLPNLMLLDVQSLMSAGIYIYIYIYRTDVIVILKELILSLLKCCVAHPSSLCHVVIPQDG